MKIKASRAAINVRFGLFYWSGMLLYYMLVLRPSQPFDSSGILTAFTVALSGFIGILIARPRNEDIDVFEDSMVAGVGVSLIHPTPFKVTGDNLDYQRSCHRTLLDRVAGNYKIYSKNGKGFSFKRYLYSKASFTDIQRYLSKIYSIDFP